MGKRYHCDYCAKTMVASPSIIKVHIKGLVHQKTVQEHYQQYKDPETILAEEGNKRPCTRFFNGGCNFGSICRYSHYSVEHLNSLREYVANKNKPSLQLPPSIEELYQKLQNEKTSKQITDCGNTIIYDSDGVAHKLPWIWNNFYDNFGDDLPPSLKQVEIENFHYANVTEWG